MSNHPKICLKSCKTCVADVRAIKETEQVEQAEPGDKPEIDLPHQLAVLFPSLASFLGCPASNLVTYNGSSFLVTLASIRIFQCIEIFRSLNEDIAWLLSLEAILHRIGSRSSHVCRAEISVIHFSYCSTSNCLCLRRMSIDDKAADLWVSLYKIHSKCYGL